ncbi:EGF domain-specific O-linked N-acetylglucosamine transferase isoform X2 [Patella vulgata]|uniref:EGF domain-specific O-linked N-acetylglucosamine transferase isoform X2 n=1 Tax=Patella vulgata TaxID=6465 RepID=UPI0024A84BB4|nr:EGF domain-specific O-linked N-acetylglucosamine transferase isoform X2 [Patella vulgata]
MFMIRWYTMSKQMLFITLSLVLLISMETKSSIWSDLHLPTEHIPFFFNNNPDIKQLCKEDKSCPYRKIADVKKCWGYESGCPQSERMKSPICDGDGRGWVKDKAAQIQKFWTDADFGYVQFFQKQSRKFCSSKEKDGAVLECSGFLRHCRAKNIFLNFKNADIVNSRNRYREDLFKEGDVGGYCDVYMNALKAEDGHKSPLQSWFAELGGYTSLSRDPFKNDDCDIKIDKPTYLIKLDAGVNMFHHFCDFVNLYATLHLNNTFSTDINIVMWDTSAMYYGDFFHDTWKAFTDNPIIHLKDYDGKKVCFKDAVFSLLARMRFGLYYNMPLIPGCHGSSLMKAFSDHVLHRMKIKQKGPHKDKIRITLLDRKSAYRNIMNQNELVSAMKMVGHYDVQVVIYDRNLPFPKQMEISHNSDIFIGMHGAGLTHVLFQPDWAVLFELHNCDDKNCYYDLARLRGVKYMTWEKEDKVQPEDEGHHPTLGAHAKFTNYEFNVEEFMRLINIAADHVTYHPQFQHARRNKYQNVKTEL